MFLWLESERMMQDQGLIINGLWIQGKGEFRASGLGSALSGSWHRLSLLSNVLSSQDLLEKHVFLCSLISLISGMLRQFEWKRLLFQAKIFKRKGNSMHLVGDEG